MLSWDERWKSPPNEDFTLPAENRPGTFYVFPDLPYDLRHTVWLKALSYERLMKISPGPTSFCEGHYQGPLMILISAPREAIGPMLNPLLLTCSESRKIAKDFYRVQLPCKYYSRKDRCGWPTWYAGVLYLCPELDIVHIHGFDHFVELATAVYENDRNRKGLLNLEISYQDLMSDQLPHFNKEAAEAAVSRLRRVIFEGPVIGISKDKELIEMPWSVPCCGRTTSFDRLPIDPRELDTTHVAVDSELRYRRRYWRRFLTNAEIDLFQCQFETEVMLNLRDPGGDGKNRTDWEYALLELQYVCQPGPSQLEPTPKSVPPVVTGFWMVPWKALRRGHGRQPSYVDIREYPPELCVAHPR